MGEEMRFHLEMQIEQNIDAGMAEEEARYAAGRQFGNQTWLKEANLLSLEENFALVAEERQHAPGIVACAAGQQIKVVIQLDTRM
jgi:hypothetical protein